MSRDSEMGKREIEQMLLRQVLDSYPILTGRQVTDEAEGGPENPGASPDFIIGLDGKAVGIELTEIRDATDAWSYFEELERLAWKKHESYTRLGLFVFPIALIAHSEDPPLFDLRRQLAEFDDECLFAGLGFSELWAIDFSDAYYSPMDPRRPADMFCFKPAASFGFHRIGGTDRKPYG